MKPMENKNQPVENKHAPPTIDKYVKKINEGIVIPEVLRIRTRSGGYISWPDKKAFLETRQPKN